MSLIGNFKKQENGNLVGSLNTLTLNVQKVTLEPIPNASEKGPDYRITANGAEIGAGWLRNSKAGNVYISVKLDDPSFNAPIYASLVENDQGEHTLIWNR